MKTMMKNLISLVLIALFCSCSEQEKKNQNVDASAFTVHDLQEILTFLLSEESPMQDLKNIKRIKVAHPGISGQLPSNINSVIILPTDGDPKSQLTVSIVSVDKKELILKADLYSDADGAEWQNMLFQRENGLWKYQKTLKGAIK